MLKAKIAELEKETTVICTGDFNTFETAEAYAEMRKDMDDTKLIAANSDTGITFHNYGAIEEHEDSAIDFVFATKGTKAETYKIIRDCIDGIYPSDHYPVIIKLTLRKHLKKTILIGIMVHNWKITRLWRKYA